MKILLIDTCGATGSVALADSERSPAILATTNLPGRTASERLIPAIKELAASSAVGLGSLDAVVVVHGPGSFTGVRVGLSAAKGLCEATGVRLVALSRLAVLADIASRNGPAAHVASSRGARIHALLDAGRGEYYHGEYVGGVCLREDLLTRDEVFAAVRRGESADVVVACEPAVAESLAAISPQLVTEPVAEDALGLALQRIRDRSFEDIVSIDSNYVRRTDAEIFAKPKAANPSRTAIPRSTSKAPVQ
jgi:tRNA threonylcarbamoyladenosine biosynthesis protein TsaB